MTFDARTGESHDVYVLATDPETVDWNAEHSAWQCPGPALIVLALLWAASLVVVWAVAVRRGERRRDA